jgi:hypothetical protein
VQEDPRFAAERGKEEFGARTGRDETEVRQRAEGLQEGLKERGEEETEDVKKKGFREKMRQVKVRAFFRSCFIEQR